MGQVSLIPGSLKQSGEVSPCKVSYIIRDLSEEEVSFEIKVYSLPGEIPLLAGETEDKIDAAIHGDSKGR